MPFYNKIPFIGKYLKSEELTSQLTPTQLAKLGETYHDVIGFGKNPTFATNAFRKLDEKRTADIGDVIGKTKGPDGDTIFDKAKDNNSPTHDAAKSVQNKLLAALKPSGDDKDDFTKALNEFNANMATFKDLVKKIPSGGFGAQDVISTLKYDVDKARAAIVARHTLDKEILADQFSKPDFKNDIMTAFSIAPGDVDAEKKVTDIKDKMVKDLAAAQKKELSEFDKTTSESFNKLLKASAEEYKQMGLIESIRKANEDNVAMLDAIAEENRRKQQLPENLPKTAVKAVHSVDKVKLSHVRLGDIKRFKSMTGMEITQPEPGTFVIDFPTISPGYYQSHKQKALADIMVVTQAIIAEGHDKIDWDITIPDEETAKETAKLKYEAGVRCGLKLENIGVSHFGKPFKLEELYKDDPESLTRLRQREKEVQAEIQGLEKTPDIKPVENSKVKEAITKIREDYKTHPPAEEEPEEEEELEEKQKTGPTGP